MCAGGYTGQSLGPGDKGTLGADASVGGAGQTGKHDGTVAE